MPVDTIRSVCVRAFCNRNATVFFVYDPLPPITCSPPVIVGEIWAHIGQRGRGSQAAYRLCQ